MGIDQRIQREIEYRAEEDLAAWERFALAVAEGIADGARMDAAQATAAAEADLRRLRQEYDDDDA